MTTSTAPVPDDLTGVATPTLAGAPAAKPALPSLPAAPARPAASVGSPVSPGVPVAVPFHQLLADARRQAPVAKRQRKVGRALRRAVLVLVLLGGLGAGGWYGYQWYEQRGKGVPSFTELLPTPTSYWMTYTARQQSGEPLEYRIQRAPGSPSIVIELTHGFGERDGQSYLMSEHGLWTFDRATGAVAAIDPATLGEWTFYDHDSRLRTFSRVITPALAPFAEVLGSSVVPADPEAGQIGDLTRYEIGLDLAAFAEDDPDGYRTWTQAMAIGSEDGGTLDPAGVPKNTYALDLTVDEYGMIWGLEMTQRDVAVFSIDVAELSSGSFVPPDPVPDPALDPTVTATSVAAP